MEFSIDNSFEPYCTGTENGRGKDGRYQPSPQQTCACSTVLPNLMGEQFHPGAEGALVILLERAQTFPRGGFVAQEANAGLRDVIDIVTAGLPIIGHPLNGVGDHGWNAFRDAIGGDDVEGFGVAGLEK